VEFEEHMAYLAENTTVIALDDALEKLKNKENFPENTVAITFDDGFKNILENGHPILQKYKFPYTIFINPAVIGTSKAQLSWEEVEQMSKENVLFANHTLDHLHLLDRNTDESKSRWLARITQNIKDAEEILREKLGYSLKWLAYPFGEYNKDVSSMLANMGYIGFGQQSGAVGQNSDMQALPRFPAAGKYANLTTLKTKIHSLAMPVKKVIPNEVVVSLGEELSTVEIVTPFDDFRASQVACYFRGSSMSITPSENGFTVAMQATFKPGRSRMNCTAPSIARSGRYYWYSLPFFTPQEDGTFLD
jgi:peptidoglycan/xylan/chitin deacetylase (PgdA/CDA1 family)